MYHLKLSQKILFFLFVVIAFQSFSATLKASITTETVLSISFSKNDAIILSAKVIGETGTPTGIVNFYDITTGTRLGSVTLSHGDANLTTTLTKESHTLFAAYIGNAKFMGSGSNLIHYPLSTVTVLTSSPNPSPEGKLVMLTATVTTQSSHASSPTGTINFYDITGSTLLGTVPLSNGEATLTTPFSSGSHSLFAAYIPNFGFLSSGSSTITQTVIPPSGEVLSTTTLNVFPSSPLLGEPVTLVAEVSPSSATGNVIFLNDGSPIGTIPLLNGSATLTIDFLTSGQHFLTAEYEGDAFYQSSISSPYTLVIEPILPPQKLQGFEKNNEFATQSDRVNFLFWEAPSEGSAPIAYKIYRDKSLNHLIAVVSNRNKLKFADHNRKKGRTYSYFIVSVNEFEKTSIPAKIKIPSKKNFSRD